ncbi:MAG: 50S ribosomal protein L15 [Proteobacteria bacterium]|nr:50S ribosomal protein L15 [Pseudomonadota bacterium]MCP4918226.1 50S ribosomal protein L15 [Pseudomonadota bacterium]
MANELANLKPAAGSTKKRTRVGRGEGSGKGRTAGRGTKGYGSRSGSGVKPGFEGGQMPLQRRLAKRGFHNVFAKDYTVINLETLEGRFEAGAVVDLVSLHEAGIVARKGKDGLKVLGRGDLTAALTIKAAKFTKSASEKIASAGGTAEVV